MAKLRLKKWSGPAARALRSRRIKIDASFRKGSDGKFEACVMVGARRVPVCRTGRNPRIALAKALHAFMGRRTGAFKGLK